MTTLHVTSTFNIESSLNAHFAEHLGVIETTWFLAPLRIDSLNVRVVYNMPEVTLNTPCFSIVHLGGGAGMQYQGNTEGYTTKTTRNYGQMDISAWVSRDKKVNNQTVWSSQLAFMQDMIMQVYQLYPNIPIRDYLSSPGFPADTGYLVRMQNLSVVQTAADPNPNIERRRVLIAYWYHARQTVS